MHTGNRFCIELRDFSVSDDQLSERINLICDKGVPNYFGQQRFGRNGNNLSEVQRLVELDKLKGNNRISPKFTLGNCIIYKVHQSIIVLKEH